MIDVASSTDGLVTVGEAAALLRLSPLTVRRKIATGELRAERVGAGPRSHYRIWSSDIANYLRANARGAVEARETETVQ